METKEQVLNRLDTNNELLAIIAGKLDNSVVVPVPQRDMGQLKIIKSEPAADKVRQYFKEHPEMLNAKVRDIADIIKVGKSTVHRVMQALKK